MKFTANIKLPIWLPIIAIVISTVFAFYQLGALSIIIFLGSLYLLVYFVLGVIRRKEAIIIDNTSLKVKSPMKHHEWEIAKIKYITLLDKNSIIKGVYITEDEEKSVTFCSAIYDVPLEDVYNFLVQHYPRLKK